MKNNEDNKTKHYMIKVSMTPHYHDNKHKPYYWALIGITENNVCCNEGFGWEESYDKAWDEARSFCKRFKFKEGM